MVVMIVYIVWNALPFKILVLLGGLQGHQQAVLRRGPGGQLPPAGASLPASPCRSSRPMLAYVVITGFIGGFKEYTSIVGIFGETMGPAGDGRTA